MTLPKGGGGGGGWGGGGGGHMTFIQRHPKVMTLHRHCIDVMCLLGSDCRGAVVYSKTVVVHVTVKKYYRLWYAVLSSSLGIKCQGQNRSRLQTDGLIVLGFNDTSTLEGHFVSSPREREKRDRRESRGDESEGQGRKRNRNESEETEEIKTFPLYPYPLQG